MTRRFLGALQFMTVLPIRGRAASPGEAAIFFPLTGAMLGASTGAVMLIFSPPLGRSLGALLALAWLIAVTGCLHEDGLADVADAVRAGRSREKMVEILADSRIGTYGAIGLTVSIAVRWQSLAQSIVNPVVGLVAAITLSRTSLVAIAAIAAPVGSGMGQAFAAACSRTVLITALTQAIAIVGLASVVMGWRHGTAMIVASTATVLLARFYFIRRLGGVNGDCLGATCQAVEMVNMVILAWHPSF